MTTQHTPTPWRIVSQHIEGPDGQTVQTEAYYPSAPPEDMKFLLHAANCHEELVAALKALLDHADEASERLECCMKIEEIARAALAKATMETQP